MSKITKTNALLYGNSHPNGINPGYTKEIEGPAPIPAIGEDYYFGTLRTTPVTEIVHDSPIVCVFKTQNSVYAIEK